jgi:NAD(P)-dependent dehydrogenase (short-subunit alcohol dehydrogenase family)
VDTSSIDRAFDIEEAFSLSGQTALVTGGGTGIGEATAKVLAGRGCDVVVASRKVENCRRVADDISQTTGRRAIALELDVRNEQSCEAAVEAAIAELGGIDILVNNAGGSYMFPFLETDLSRFDNNMALNLRGPYHLIQLAAPSMIERQGGAIVNISSGAGISGVRGGAVYSASKAGLQMLTRVVAAELGPKGVRCNAIAVGAVASEGALRSWERFGMSAESAGAGTPLRRVGQPLDIALGVYYLCSDLSSWVSGQTLSIDGGPSMGGLPDQD